jgi:hypothetical protein
LPADFSTGNGLSLARLVLGLSGVTYISTVGARGVRAVVKVRKSADLALLVYRYFTLQSDSVVLPEALQDKERPEDVDEDNG